MQPDSISLNSFQLQDRDDGRGWEVATEKPRSLRFTKQCPKAIPPVAARRIRRKQTRPEF
jgi:hypothetical protein